MISGESTSRTCRVRSTAAACLMSVCSFLLVVGSARADLVEEIRERMRVRIESAMTRGVLPGAAGEALLADDALVAFYERRGYRPAWSLNGEALPEVESLMAAVRRADEEGLRPSDYHFAELEQLRLDLDRSPWHGRINATSLWVDLDILCTDAFLVYGSHCLSGRVNPRTIDPEWFALPRQADLVGALERAVSERNIGVALSNLLPRQPGYARLRRALADYRLLAREGGWPQIDLGPTLRRGDRGARVAQLHQRLQATEDLTDPVTDSLFTEITETAVRRFQARFGLEPDGLVGPTTLLELNRTPADRVRQIIVNMERWRWLPDDLGSRHVRINIANFELDLVEQDSIVRVARAIVGRSYRRTPVISDRITYMVVNPSWTVPPNIVSQDLLPMVRKDSTYLRVNGFELLDPRAGDLRPVDPATVPAAVFAGQHFPYLLRQKPGPQNALGKIKFMFPNAFNVYMHDTPTRGLFARAKRDFSSGCIRIEDPFEVAVWLLHGEGGWTPEKLRTVIDSPDERTIGIPSPVPIHLLYWTAWVTPDDRVHFREDLYNRDAAVADALEEQPPDIGADAP